MCYLISANTNSEKEDLLEREVLRTLEDSLFVLIVRKRFQTHVSSAILAWSESTSKSIPSVSDTIVVEPQLCSSTLNTSAARTCHVCGLKYTKSMKKKVCTCKKFCHVKCYGKCIL